MPQLWGYHGCPVAQSQVRTESHASEGKNNAATSTGVARTAETSIKTPAPGALESRKDEEKPATAREHIDSAARVLIRRAILASLNKRLEKTTGREHKLDVLDCLLASGEDMIRQKQRELEALQEKMESIEHKKKKILQMPREPPSPTDASAKRESYAPVIGEGGK